MKGEIRTMKKITAMDYKRAARDAMKKTVGFAPALKNIIPMEGGDNGEIVTDVAFCIAATGKGYSWRIGGEVEELKRMTSSLRTHKGKEETK